MFDSLPFATLIMGEIIFLLSVITVLMGLLIRKQRQRHQFLLEEYRKLRQHNHSVFHMGELNELDVGTPAADDPVDRFLNEATNDSLVRYRKTAQANLPRLSPELPFSAKVAALRYFFNKAEAEVRKQKTVREEHWMQFEKQLADIARWVTTPKKLSKPLPNNRIRLLQEKIDFLQPFEKENERLQRKLAAAEARYEHLTEYERESKQTLAKMHNIIQALQMANAYKGGDVDQKIQDALQPIDQDNHWTPPYQSYQNSVSQLDNIADISERKYSLVRKMVDELPFAYTDLNDSQRQKMSDSIRALELDLVKSDHHITNLQKELKAAKDSMKRPAIVVEAKPVTPFNKYAPGKEMLVHPLPQDAKESIADAPTEETLTIIHSGIPDAEPKDELPNDWISGGGHKRTYAEIEQLRTNNQNQRSIIIDLEKELRSLRKSMHETTDEEEKRDKSKDIERLERLIKECEYCIETLESEVDLLHEQLKQSVHPDTQQSKPLEEVEKLNRELESISSKLQHTIKQHTQTSIINRLAVEALSTETLEDLSKLLIKAIKDLNITAGFYLQSQAGNAEYYTGNKFTPSEQKLLRQPGNVAAVAYLNEGILFARPNAHILLRNPPDDDDEQLQLENTLSNIVSIISGQIDYKEANNQLQKQSRKLDVWVADTKKQLQQLDIQYAYQSEESRRIVNNLSEELKRSMEMLEMPDSTRLVFDNAISECNQRLLVLFDSGKMVDKIASKLMSSLGNLHKQIL